MLDKYNIELIETPHTESWRNMAAKVKRQAKITRINVKQYGIQKQVKVNIK